MRGQRFELESTHYCDRCGKDFATEVEVTLSTAYEHHDLCTPCNNGLKALQDAHDAVVRQYLKWIVGS